MLDVFTMFLPELFGSVVGGVKHILSEGFNLFRRNQDHRHSVALMRLQEELNAKQQDTKTNVAAMKYTNQDMVSARDHDVQLIKKASPKVVSVIALTRPFMSVTGYISYYAGLYLISPEVLEGEAWQSYTTIVRSMVSFWFVDRGLYRANGK
jgi:hypothetical protein